MEVAKLLVVFAVIILIVMVLKKPLYWATGAASLTAVVIYGLNLTQVKDALIAGVTGSITLQALAVLYTLTFLQKMMEDRKQLANSQVAFSGLFNSNRVNATVVPFILGMLPAAPTVIICGPIVRSAIGDELTTEEKAACTSYYRHISESFFPTYSNIFIAIGLTGGRVNAASFMLGMLPMVAVMFLVGHLVYMRKVPKDAGIVIDQPKSYYWKMLFQSIWPIAFIIVLILVCQAPVYLACVLGIVANAIVGKFSLTELKGYVVRAINPAMMLTTVMGMIMREVLSATGAIVLLPEVFAQLPIPWWLVYALMFFCGTFVAAGTMNILCMPMVMAALPAGHTGLAIFILLMTLEYAAMQFNPSHICLALCADDYKISLGSLIKKVLPMAGLIIVATFGYFLVLYSLGF